MTVFEIEQGSSPLILSFPHTGTHVPEAIWNRLNDNGKRLADTDWHVHRLYAGLVDGATTVRATFHRSVIDANRDPGGHSLYPGQNTTGLVPETDFDGLAIWHEGQMPGEDEIAERLVTFHRPYHAALAAEIERVKALHGVAIVYDCHSIRSHIPYLFEGKLPDFNIGTDSGKTCAALVEQTTLSIASEAPGYHAVLNGRFKGGWSTRHYGRPADNVHAIQMELAQSTYLKSEDQPFDYDEEKAEHLRLHLKAILNGIVEVAQTLI